MHLACLPLLCNVWLHQIVGHNAFAEAHRAIDAEGAVLGKKDKLMFVGC